MIKKVYRKKIYLGMVELKDYERDNFVRLNTPVRMIVGDEYMDISVAELKKGTYINTQYSIHNPGQKYKLLGWRWHGTPYRDPQVSLFPDISKLKEAMKRNGVKL